MRVDKPAVAEARGALYCAVVVGGEPDRRIWLLDRSAGHCHIGQFADVVLEADIVLGPQPLDHFEALLETAHALTERHAKGIELDIAVAETHAKDKIPAPDRVERGDVLGDFDRVVQRSQQHAGNAGHLPGFGRQARQKRHQLDLAHPFAQIVLACRNGVPAAVARQPGHRVLAREHDDTAALNAWFRGETVVWAQTHEKAGAEITDRTFLLSSTVYVSGGTGLRLDHFRMIWPWRKEVVSGGTITTGYDPNAEPRTEGIAMVGADPDEGVPYESPAPEPLDHGVPRHCLTS